MPGKHRGGVNTREAGKGVFWEAGTGGVLGRKGCLLNTNSERQQRSNTAAFPDRLSILCDNFRIVVLLPVRLV